VCRQSVVVNASTADTSRHGNDDDDDDTAQHLRYSVSILSRVLPHKLIVG